MFYIRYLDHTDGFLYYEGTDHNGKPVFGPEPYLARAMTRMTAERMLRVCDDWLIPDAEIVTSAVYVD